MRIVDVVTCDFTPGLGDGVRRLRGGDVHVVRADNLFKTAPAIGREVAAAVAA